MHGIQTDDSSLESEYRTLVHEAGWDDPIDDEAADRLEASLTRDGMWTPDAAAEIVRLARLYGSFMLRNALALAVTMGVEDGTLGY